MRNVNLTAASDGKLTVSGSDFLGYGGEHNNCLLSVDFGEDDGSVFAGADYFRIVLDGEYSDKLYSEDGIIIYTLPQSVVNPPAVKCQVIGYVESDGEVNVIAKSSVAKLRVDGSEKIREEIVNEPTYFEKALIKAEQKAEESELAAVRSEGAAEEAEASALRADSYKSAASTKATDAVHSASLARGYAEAAELSKQSAAAKVTEASGYAESASDSATDASGYAGEASASADTAGGYASAAEGSAAAAALSATAAAESAASVNLNAVHYTAESKTEAEKAQARMNIGIKELGDFELIETVTVSENDVHVVERTKTPGNVAYNYSDFLMTAEIDSWGTSSGSVLWSVNINGDVNYIFVSLPKQTAKTYLTVRFKVDGGRLFVYDGASRNVPYHNAYGVYPAITNGWSELSAITKIVIKPYDNADMIPVGTVIKLYGR